MTFIQSPEFQSGVLPFLLGLGIVLVVLIVGRAAASRWVVTLLPAGFLLTYWVLEGVAGFPPVASKQKVFYLAALAALIGFCCHAFQLSRLQSWTGAFLWVAVSLLWLTSRQLGSAGFGLIATLAVLAVASLLVFALLLDGAAAEKSGRTGALKSGGALLAAAFATGIVSLQGAFIGMAQLAVTVGALLGGFLLVAWVAYVRSGFVFSFGPAGAIGLGGAWLSCVYVMVLFAGQVNRWALALILFTFLLMPLAARLRSTRDGALGRALQPIFYGAIVAVPSLAAAVWVLAAGSADSGYG